MSDMFRFDGKTVVVIGSGSGIGRAVALGAAQQGARIGCADVNADSARETAERITRQGAVADHAALDITDAAATDRVLDQFASSMGRLDGLACTPSINVRKKLLDYNEDEFDHVVRLNLKGSFNVVRSAGRIMTRQGGGSIVIFSSIRSLVVEPGQAIYAMTKAGIVQLVRGAACEFGPSGVRVNALGPGVIETPLTAPIKAQPEWYQAYANKNILKRWGRVEEMVGPTLFLLSDAASYVTGTILYADGGWLAADGRFTPPGM
ncbi:MAG TPA: SDR family NAD(P)-dependent oxidoreductase [Vicinamibacterales bacterium]|nr:SDR family NAD(P)-dependent oxidoreductase [Vicinamibacterales bacterium]